MKLTRKSYNRRVFTFGTLVFLAVALMSTGFATWVMSTNANTSTNGNVNVGTITDGALSFIKTGEDTVVFDTNTGKHFQFGAKKDDTDGDMKASTASDAVYENLSVKFTVQVQPAQYFDYLKVELTDLDTGLTKAADAGYIVLPDAAKNVVKINDQEQGIEVTNDDNTSIQPFTTDTTTVDSTTTPGTVKITYTINFKWGSVFEGENPGIYLDEAKNQDNSAKYSYNQKIATMVAFKKTIHNLPDDTTDSDALNYKPTSPYSYTLKVTAVAK